MITGLPRRLNPFTSFNAKLAVETSTLAVKTSKKPKVDWIQAIHRLTSHQSLKVQYTSISVYIRLAVDVQKNREENHHLHVALDRLDVQS